MRDRDVDVKYHFVKTPYLRYSIRTRQRFEQLQTLIEENPLTTTELIARTGLKSYTVQRLLRQLKDDGNIKKALGRWYASDHESDYLTIVEVARILNVGTHTIRQKIRDGDIFKGAKKKEAPGVGRGEIWIIPRSEVESVSLKEIAPKLYQKRYVNKLEPHDKDNNAVPTASLGELEERVSVLEQRMVRRLLDR